MIKVDETNIEETKEFVIENLKRSGFIYGNLSEATSVSYIFKKEGKIVAMANVLGKKHCTYLFPKNTTELIIREVIEAMQSIEHKDGTVIGDYFDIMKDYYQLPANAINEVASLTIDDNNPYEGAQAKYIGLDDVEGYIKAVDTITEFVPRQPEEVKSTFQRTQGKYVAIKGENNQILSSACLTAISDKTAVVIAVFTVKEHEGRGLAKDCLSKLLQDYARGRTIFIFFTNPKAKALYLKLGFEVEEKLIMFNELKNTPEK